MFPLGLGIQCGDGDGNLLGCKVQRKKKGE
jgi:hypothetical protein